MHTCIHWAGRTHTTRRPAQRNYIRSSRRLYYYYILVGPSMARITDALTNIGKNILFITTLSLALVRIWLRYISALRSLRSIFIAVRRTRVHTYVGSSVYLRSYLFAPRTPLVCYCALHKYARMFF